MSVFDNLFKPQNGLGSSNGANASSDVSSDLRRSFPSQSASNVDLSALMSPEFEQTARPGVQTAKPPTGTRRATPPTRGRATPPASPSAPEASAAVEPEPQKPVIDPEVQRQADLAQRKELELNATNAYFSSLRRAGMPTIGDGDAAVLDKGIRLSQRNQGARSVTNVEVGDAPGVVSGIRSLSMLGINAYEDIGQKSLVLYRPIKGEQEGGALAPQEEMVARIPFSSKGLKDRAPDGRKNWQIVSEQLSTLVDQQVKENVNADITALEKERDQLRASGKDPKTFSAQMDRYLEDARRDVVRSVARDIARDIPLIGASGIRGAVGGVPLVGGMVAGAEYGWNKLKNIGDENMKPVAVSDGGNGFPIMPQNFPKLVAAINSTGAEQFNFEDGKVQLLGKEDKKLNGGRPIIGEFGLDPKRALYMTYTEEEALSKQVRNDAAAQKKK
ncbi:MAG: hypothetical protein IT290_10845 [Deltaproteobacteria bacterium]|nr:hypothetical protein [Deltaproteobacteria bacterium]